MKGNNMKGKQRGMTLIGFVIGLIVFCFFAYMAMVLLPAYNEFFGVQKAMSFVASQYDKDDADAAGMMKMLNKQFNVGYVESVDTAKDVKLIRDKAGNVLSADYEVRKAFVYNIDFVLKFHHDVKLGKPGQ